MRRPRPRDARDGTPPAVVSRTVHVGDPDGLHARPCTRLARAVEDFRAVVTVACDGRTADARSVLALLGLGVVRPADVEIRATGDDAAACVAAAADALCGGKPAPRG